MAQAKNLNGFRQLDQEFLVAFQMMDFGRVTPGEAAHRFHALPIRDCDEFSFLGAILAKSLHAHRFFDQRLDAGFVIASYASARARVVRPRQMRAIFGREAVGGMASPFVKGNAATLFRSLREG
jgi:hypothetical protein